MDALYFAYGSNLSRQRQDERNLELELVGLAKLENHALWFPRYSEKQCTGVASFRSCAGEAVHGVVFRATDADWQRLDKEEGVKIEAYRKVQVDVVMIDEGVTQNVQSYEANPQVDAPFHPSADYLGHIITGAEEWNLPSEWVCYLRALARS